MLLHRIENWHPVQLLYIFSKFSNARLWKPQRKHTVKSMFYMIAKAGDAAAREAVEG